MDKQILFDALDDADLIDRSVSRRQAFLNPKVLGVGMALAAAPLALGGLVKKAFAQESNGFRDQDINALNFALTLERLEAEFYPMGVENLDFPTEEERDIFSLISANEIAHRDFLEGLLGDLAARRPEFDFTLGGEIDPFNDYDTYLILAQGFEDAGVRAYKGQLGQLQGNAVAITMGARIHSVEARHASLVRRLRGERAGVLEEAPWKGWPTFNNVDSAAAPFIQPIYDGEIGEDNTMQLGIDTATLGSGEPGLPDAAAASEAFDEPLGLQEVLAIAGQFGTGRTLD